MAVVRVPDASDGGIIGLGQTIVAALRRNHELLPVLAVHRLAVGQPMLLMVDVRWDGIPTLRMTTVVRRLEALSGIASRPPGGGRAS